jgi:NAD(P)-dependent dehydrogenase (short-subunit alcohol dehydrogenase family)
VIKALQVRKPCWRRLKVQEPMGVIHQCNISEEEDVKKMFAEILTQFGTVDRICR